MSSTALASRRRPQRSASRPAGSGAASLGVSVLWLSLLVVLPLAAVVGRAFDDGWTGFHRAVTRHQAVAALQLTLGVSLVVALVSAITGTLVAWVLVRDDFRGRRILDALVDLPFAIPTVVVSLLLLGLVGARSPVGIHLAGTRSAILVALLLVTLPFVVRSVQPVLSALDRETEEAALSLGASPWQTFQRVVLPALGPSIISGAALAFARAVGEFGSLVLVSGNIPLRTQVASVYIFTQIESDNPRGASAVAVVLLALSVGVLVLLRIVERRTARRG
jgi:sulfate transport system permease protein